MGDGTGTEARVDSLAEWQAAAEEVRRLERVAQGKRETLLSAARADAEARAELVVAGRRLLGLERALIAGTALAGPVDVTGALGMVERVNAQADKATGIRAGLNATRAEINGAARKVPVEDWGGADFALPPATGWQSDKLAPRSKRDPDAVAEIFTVHPEPGDQVRMDDVPEAISAANEAGALLGRPAIKAGEMKSDAPSTDYYAGVADKRRAPKPEASPADYWSGAARNPRRWWQVWRKK